MGHWGNFKEECMDQGLAAKCAALFLYRIVVGCIRANRDGWATFGATSEGEESGD